MSQQSLTAPTRLETARLVLRRPRAEDEAALIALDSEPDVLDYLVMRGADAKDMAGRVRARIAAAEAQPAAIYGWWVIEGKGDGVFHGRGLLAPTWEGGRRGSWPLPEPRLAPQRHRHGGGDEHCSTTPSSIWGCRASSAC